MKSVMVFGWCALDGHQRTLYHFRHMASVVCVCCATCFLLSVPSHLVTSLLFKWLHLCLPQPRLSPYLLSCCLQSCADPLF